MVLGLQRGKGETNYDKHYPVNAQTQEPLSPLDPLGYGPGSRLPTFYIPAVWELPERASTTSWEAAS